MKKDTPKNKKQVKKEVKKEVEKALKNDTFNFKIVMCDNKFATLELIIIAFGRCCALFIKAFIIGLAIKSALF